jgi:hypothetical protein
MTSEMQPARVEKSKFQRAVAYYTVADAPFFPGVAALINSLRLTGHDGGVFVVDCGLTESQKDRLAGSATIVEPHGELHPVLQKVTGPMLHPADIMVLVDADILVTRSLVPLFEEAALGRIVGFEDSGFPDRYFPDWASLGLGTPVRRPYVNCGLLVLSEPTASTFMAEFLELQEQLDPRDTHFGGGPVAGPLYFADQDLLNAMLCTRYDDRATRLARRMAPMPPFPALAVLGAGTLACAYDDGVVPYALHHVQKKPWLSPVPANAYSTLFRRVVRHESLAVIVRSQEIPLRLRSGPAAAIDRFRVSVQSYLHMRFRGRLGIRRLAERWFSGERVNAPRDSRHSASQDA